MKSVLSNKKTKYLKSYPYLGIYTADESNFIVLFTKKNKGTVVHREDGGELGAHSITWNEECFSPYEYAITLSN